MRRVALGPDPQDAMLPGELIELLPEVAIQNGLFRGGHSVLLLPAVNPGGDSVLHVFGIGDDLDFNVGIVWQERRQLWPENGLDGMFAGRNPDGPGRFLA